MRVQAWNRSTIWHSASHPSSTILSRRRVQFTFDRTCNYRVGILPLNSSLALSISRGTRLNFEKMKEQTSGILSVYEDRGILLTDATDEKKMQYSLRTFQNLRAQAVATSRAAHFYRTLAYHKKTNRPFPAPVGLHLYSQRFEISLLRFLMFVPESLLPWKKPCTSDFQVIATSTILCGNKRCRWSANKTNIERIFQP